MNISKKLSLLTFGLCTIGCQSIAAPTSITYTKIADCTEQIENENAAFSESKCNSIGPYALNITQQSPLYFNIILSRDGKSITSELDTFSQEEPMEPGKAIEWHVTGETPKFMIFRIFVLQENSTSHEQLTISLVTEDRICPIASVNVNGTPKANEKVRSLISERYQNLAACPAEIDIF